MAEGASEREPTAINFAFNSALDVLTRRDIEARPLLNRAGLSDEHIGDSPRRVSAAAQARFLEYAAEALGDGALGLHLAEAGVDGGLDPRLFGGGSNLG